MFGVSREEYQLLLRDNKEMRKVIYDMQEEMGNYVRILMELQSRISYLEKEVDTLHKGDPS